MLRSINVVTAKVDETQVEVELEGHCDPATEPIFWCQLLERDLEIQVRTVVCYLQDFSTRFHL